MNPDILFELIIQQSAQIQYYAYSQHFVSLLHLCDLGGAQLQRVCTLVAFAPPKILSDCKWLIALFFRFSFRDCFFIIL